MSLDYSVRNDIQGNEINMEPPSIDQIRELVPRCTEIRTCPELDSCVKKDDRLCHNKDKPCYITSRGERIEGIILLDFKNNLVILYKFGEKDEYARIVTPEGIDVKMDGREPKEKLKKILKSMR